MADWGILRSYHDDNMSQYHTMTSLIDCTFSSQSCYDENSFCTPDNVDPCLTHLSQELTNLGLKPLSRDGVMRTTTLINSLHEILRMYQRSNRIKEELENRLHRSSCDNTENQSVIRRLKSSQENLEREVAQEKEKHRQTQHKVKGITSKLKQEKDELKRMQSVVKDRDAQYKHELKKKQREVNKLMERLHQLLMDKNPDRRIGMDMVGLLHKGDSKRSTWKSTPTSNKQEEMYQVLITNIEQKQSELRLENSDLRDCLLDMQRQLSSLLTHTACPTHATVDLSPSDSDTDISTASSCDLTDDYFQMPYDMLRENLQKRFRDMCKKIRENVQRCSNNAQSGSTNCPSSQTWSPSHHNEGWRESEGRNEETEKLKKQIDKYKDIVKQQEELIQQSLHTQSKSMENTFLQESQILQEKESLSEQRRKFYQEKANFEEERRKFNESALQLQQERKQMETEKASLLRSQILHMSTGDSKPSTPKSSKGDKTRLLPSTPVFSPAPGKGKPPSAAELLKMLTKQSSGSETVCPPKRRSLPRSGSPDSLHSSCLSAHSFPSTHSAPSDLMHHSSVSSKRLSLEELEEIEQSLLSHRRRRHSSAGNQSDMSEL